MGKSTSGDLLRQLGVSVIDTDVIARVVVEPGKPALAEVEQRFGPGTIKADGCLNREELARIVFADASARQDLELILHPRIRAIWREQIDVWSAEGQPSGVVIIPLLFETRSEALFDATLCVACSGASQVNRLLGRGWSKQQLEQRIASQMATHEKIVRSDFVVWTDTTLEVHEAQLRRIFR